jgi:RHS repeat-associated protein
VEQLFGYAAASTVPARVDDTMRGTVDYTSDPLGQILSRLPQIGVAENFSYDPAGAIVEPSTRRDYAAGGRLVVRGETRYVYDNQHRVIEKRAARVTGVDEVWRYEWGGNGLLATTIRPDGGRVENTYDVFARRIQKLVRNGDGTFAYSVRYVWDGDNLVHELRSNGGKMGHAIVEERTYAFEPNSISPIAHRDARLNGARINSDWVHYLSDGAGRPEMLVDDGGSVLSVFDQKLWGRVEPILRPPRATTTARFAGQWEDTETGLFYNRYRFYDPDSGQYMSPEPLGLAGGLRPFGYAENRTLDQFDPDGLMTANGPNGLSAQNGPVTSSNGGGHDTPSGLHPIVDAALARPSLENAYGNTMRNPQTCAEPKLLSQYLDQYAAGPPPRPLDNPAAVKDALNGFTSQAVDDNGVKRAPCRNCSQMFANLMAQHGAPDPKNIGAGMKKGQKNGDPVNFTPPGAKAPPGTPTAYPI